MSLEVLSQNTTPRTDTCFGPTEVRKLLIGAQRADLLQDDIRDLNNRITEKERQLASSNTRDSITIAALSKEMFILKDQKGIVMGELTALNKQLRKERTKIKLVGIAGIITTLAGVILIK